MDDTIQKIEGELKKNKVVIFMKGTPEAPRCGFSAATVAVLKTFPYPFAAVDILANPDKLVGGCDIMHELRDSGELEQILKDAFKNA
jgi:monothiol glutaredoxin